MGWCDEGFRRGSMMGGGRFMFPFLAFFVFAVVAVAVILFIVWLVRRSGHTKANTGQTAVIATPMSIVERRLAAGEITVEEFEKIRAHLTNQDE